MHSNYKVNLEHYKVFYQTALWGSMTKAAEALYIGQPAVSKTIKSIEDTLEVSLFVRSHKGLTLTDEGQKLFEHVSLAMEQIKLAENSIENMKKYWSEPIKIDVCAMMFKLLILPKLTSLFEIYNKNDYEISPTIDSYSSLSLLDNNQIDCCIVTKPLDMSNLKFIKLFTFHDYLMGSPQYLNKIATNNGKFEKNATLISVMNGNIISSYERQRLKKINFKNSMKVTSMEHTIALAKLDHGIGFIAEELVRDELLNKQLVKVDIPFPYHKREVGFLLNKKVKMREPLQNFINYYVDLSLIDESNSSFV